MKHHKDRTSYATLSTHDPHPTNQRQKGKKFKIQEHRNYFHLLVTIPQALYTLLSSKEKEFMQSSKVVLYF